MRTAVTGWSLYLPGIRPRAALAAHFGPALGAWADAEVAPADRAAAVLGRKGLLYKEPATRLALCAVHAAMGLPPGRRPDGPLSPRTAVVACGNLGNVQTVAQVAHAAVTEGGRSVSILDAPNVSSNVIASTVAIWFRLGGPNLMVCSGETAGLDGLALAGLLLAARRADRVVLVGAEPADEVAVALHGTTGPATPLRAGAACVILERPTGGDRIELISGPTTGPVATTGPDGFAAAATGSDGFSVATIGPDGFDPARSWGDHYGAEGVVALALAAHLIADRARPVIAVHDAVHGAVLVRPGSSR